MISPKHILLTIDVEDWFQVENFKPWIPFETWDQRELRVEKNVHRLLNLFDSLVVAGKPGRWESGKVGTNGEIDDQNKELNGPNQHSQPNQLNNSSESVYNAQLTTNKSHAAAPAANKQLTTNNKSTKNLPKATFFVLGWLADRLPNLVREIQSRGHEVASHGHNHKLPDQLPAADFKMDLTDSKKRLEDLIGSAVSGYRAPSFAINDPILKIIEDCDYCYDSSYNSFGLHGRYGKISLNRADKKGIAHKLSDNFYELPISNLRIKGRFFPLGGGAYFRLIPLPMFNLGVKSILQKEGAYLFYMHPWEIDSGQPRVDSASFNSKFRHYTNLNRTKTRLKRLIENFGQHRFVTCSEYLMQKSLIG